MVIKESTTVDRLIVHSKRRVIRKQIFVILLQRLIFVAVFIIVGAIIGQLTHIAKWYGFVPGIIFVMYLYIFKNAEHFNGETIQLLQIEYLSNLKQQNKQKPKRVLLINRVLTLLQTK